MPNITATRLWSQILNEYIWIYAAIPWFICDTCEHSTWCTNRALTNYLLCNNPFHSKIEWAKILFLVYLKWSCIGKCKEYCCHHWFSKQKKAISFHFFLSTMCWTEKAFAIIKLSNTWNHLKFFVNFTPQQHSANQYQIE